MAENETEISTPVETVETDTSENVEPEKTDTSNTEPETDTPTAETETNNNTQELLAGKYKNVEELVNGYKSLESKLGQPNEYEQKYNELLKQKEEETKRIREYQQKNAMERGFKSPEEAKISDMVQVQEFNYYWNNLNTISPEYSN